MGMSDLMTESSDFTASSDFSDSDFSLSSLGDLVLKSILEAGDFSLPLSDSLLLICFSSRPFVCLS